MKKRYSFEDFTEIVKKLRSPGGCPWDQEQTHESLKPCMINETAEAMAAVDVWRRTGDSGNLCEELGDMLLQVVLQSQIAADEGLFDISDVVQAVSEKMLRRHPHVFTENKQLPDWEELKRAEKVSIPPSVQAIKSDALRQAHIDIAEHIKNQMNRDKSAIYEEKS